MLSDLFLYCQHSCLQYYTHLKNNVPLSQATNQRRQRSLDKGLHLVENELTFIEMITSHKLEQQEVQPHPTKTKQSDGNHKESIKRDQRNPMLQQ
jgi:hypothetical protein